MDKKEKEPTDLEKCQRERDEYLAGWQRAKADFSNYKKEEAQRFADFAKISQEALVAELIAVLDSFELGLAVSGSDSASEKGMLLIKNQLEDTLKKYGLEKINVEIGKPFDPKLQEAIAEVESERPPGTVVEVAGTGYLLGGRVLRPAKVKLSKQHG
ncbi:MAG TPA: nucleotide exchange factor GrpE [Candidatus Paceibacterota bacterium]|nr:nucleotide exchange factor GrpE [Candidatus Paceibacterota bacterium]